MEVVGALVALAPIVGLMVLLVLRTRRMWRRPPVVIAQPPKSQPNNGGDLSGDRMPRRPLVPAGAGSIALPIPEDDEVEAPDPQRPGATMIAGDRLLAS